jgi:hypothetical protein
MNGISDKVRYEPRLENGTPLEELSEKQARVLNMPKILGPRLIQVESQTFLSSSLGCVKMNILESKSDEIQIFLVQRSISEAYMFAGKTDGKTFSLRFSIV